MSRRPVRNKARISDKPTILAEAAAATDGARPTAYGHPLDHFSRTAGMINARFAHKLREPITAEEWAQMMILDKVARLGGSLKRDTIVDVAGYARTIELCGEERARRGQP